MSSNIWNHISCIIERSVVRSWLVSNTCKCMYIYQVSLYEAAYRAELIDNLLSVEYVFNYIEHFMSYVNVN